MLRKISFTALQASETYAESCAAVSRQVVGKRWAKPLTDTIGARDVRLTFIRDNK